MEPMDALAWLGVIIVAAAVLFVLAAAVSAVVDIFKGN